MSDEAQVTIRFLIDVDKHTNVRVVGNIDALGQWTPASGLRTRWLKNTLFEAQITIKNIKNIIEYKYVSCPDNEADLKWEEGPVNRTLDTSESNFLQVQEHFKTHMPHFYIIDPVFINFDKIFGRTIEPKRVLKPQGDHALIRFQVAAGTMDPKDYIIICGNSKAFDKITMQYTYEKWELDVLVPLADFPIEYKYATVEGASAPNYVEETCQNRSIQLPTTVNSQNIVVQLHDVYTSQSPSKFTCFTTPISHGKCREWIKLRSRAYLDPADQKIVVSNTYDTQAALRYRKPFKVRQSSGETFTIKPLHEAEWQLLVDALTDPECTLPKIELGEPQSESESAHSIDRFAGIVSNNTSFTDLTIFTRALNSDKLCTAIGSHKNIARLTLTGTLNVSLCEALGRLLAMTRTIYHLCLTLEDFPALIWLYKYLNITTSVYSLKLKVGDPFVNEDQASELRGLIKHNVTIKNLALEIIPHTESLRKALELNDDFFEVNWALTECQFSYLALAPAYHPALACLERNKKYQRDMLAKTVIILYNMVRSTEALVPLPIELWLQIFSFIRYPGRQIRFDAVFEALLGDSRIRRVIAK